MVSLGTASAAMDGDRGWATTPTTLVRFFGAAATTARCDRDRFIAHHTTIHHGAIAFT